MKNLPFRAELLTDAGTIGIIDAETIAELRLEIKRVWLPILEPGDTIVIIENEEV